MVLTISDIFNSLKEETFLNTPTLTEDSTRHRSSRILSLGLIYNFGLTKRPKSEKLQFDNSMEVKLHQLAQEGPSRHHCRSPEAEAVHLFIGQIDHDLKGVVGSENILEILQHR